MVGVAVLLVSTAAAPGPTLNGPGGSRLGDAQVFATVPDPGHPEGVVVDGDLVHVTTTAWAAGLVGGDGVPSRIFSFDRATGALVGEVVIEGEDTRQFHGAGGIVLDGEGNRYATVNPYPHPETGRTGAAVVRVAPDGTQSLVALVPDLPPCLLGLVSPCSPAAGDRAPLANDLVFDEAGNLYVSDSFQATIWRVEPAAHGQLAQPWLQDASLDGLAVGPNGLRVSPDGDALLVAVMAHRGTEGSIQSIPLVDQPAIEDVEVLHAFDGGAPDGFTFGTSGRLYVVLGEGAVAVLDPTAGWAEVDRFTTDLLHGPASPAFDDATRSLLITNHAFDSPDPDHQTVVRMFVDDTGLPLATPILPRT